jgi:uncharacterized damage-inducible protein DinB
MKSKSSKELIDILEQEVEKHLQDAIRIFQNLTPESLLKPSASGGWSIAQCLWHLNSYGEYYFPEIRKGLTKNYPFNPEFKSSWLGNYLKMKKYKAFKDHTPAPALDAHEVVAKFIQQQEELLDLLKLARHTDLNKVRIPISISRWLKLKLGDVFQFIIAHNERHLHQAKRNM